MKLRLPELHYNLGHVLHQQGDLVKATAAYQQAVRLDASFVQAYHSLAVVLGEQRQYEAAVDHYQQVIALRPSDAKAYNNLACVLVEQGKLEEALDIYRQAIALEPEWATLYSNFGKAIESQDPVAAVTAYRYAIELEPKLIAAHYNLGQLWLKQGQYSAAISAFQQLLALDAAHLEAHTGCGFALFALGDFQAAFDHFYQSLLPQQAYIAAFCEWSDQLAADDQLALVRKSCSQLLQALLRSDACELTASARQSNQKASQVTLSPGSFVDRKLSSQICHRFAQTYLHLGDLLMQYGGAKQYQQAEHYYQQALRLQPENLELYLRLGNCLAQQKRWNAAITTYHFALLNYPKSALLYHGLGQTLEQQQRWTEAISYYRKALQLTQQNQQSVQQEYGLNAHLPNQVSTHHSRPTEINVNCDIQSAFGLAQVVCLSTLDWIKQNRSSFDTSFDISCYVRLKPGSDRFLIPTFIDLDSNVELAGELPLIAQENTGQHELKYSACDGLNCHRCLKKITNQFAPLHLGRGVYRCPTRLSNIEPPPYFVAQIPQAQAWMTPYQTPWMVANSVAILTADGYLLNDVSREYPGQLPTCQFHSTVQRISQPQAGVKVEQIKGRVAALSGLSGHNYFHWMIDILPRLELLQRSGLDLNQIDWFWINHSQLPFQQETLRQLGISEQKILSSDHHSQIQAEQLIVPSFAGHLGWLEPWALAFLRRQFLQKSFLQQAGLNSSYGRSHPERIYISRANAHHRRVLNEPAILERLQSLGFVTVELESMSLAEQISLFCHAKVIVAPHGGGLTNLIFCTPGTTVIEFFSPNYIRHYYWVISQQLGLQHYFTVGDKFACTPIHRLMYPSPLMEDIWIDLEALDVALTQCGLNVA